MRHAFHHRRLRVRALLVAVPAIVVVASACGSLPSVPNPFAPSATPRPTLAVPAQVTPTTRPVPTPVTEEAAEPFEPFWVRNHRITELWSGASVGPDTISFGATSGQFCSFLVVLPPEGDRLYVLNPYSRDYLWIDAADVGPAGAPDPPASGRIRLGAFNRTVTGRFTGRRITLLAAPPFYAEPVIRWQRRLQSWFSIVCQTPAD